MCVLRGRPSKQGGQAATACCTDKTGGTAHFLVFPVSLSQSLSLRPSSTISLPARRLYSSPSWHEHQVSIGMYSPHNRSLMTIAKTNHSQGRSRPPPHRSMPPPRHQHLKPRDWRHRHPEGDPDQQDRYPPLLRHVWHLRPLRPRRRASPVRTTYLGTPRRPLSPDIALTPSQN
jgi:hypothetical protein